MSEENALGAANEQNGRKRPGVLDGIDPFDPLVRAVADKINTDACTILDEGASAAAPAAEASVEGIGSALGEAAGGVVDAIGNILDGL